MSKPRAPKGLLENLRYRREIIQLGDESESAREDIILHASRDPVWFIDTFLFGFNPKDHPDCPERLFVLYPFQEEAVAHINGAIGRHNLVAPKSRAVGGTYTILATLFHRWMFRPMQTFLLASAKEDRVDEYDDPDCLFWKLDHFLASLPWWLRPPVDRVKLRLVNLATRSVFNGETTNKDLARGGRRTAVLADETAAMPKSEQIIASLLHVTNCNIFLSTPQGAWGGFYKLWEKYSRDCPDWILRMHWTQHPVYSQGLYFQEGRARSPWYDQQCLNAPGPRWIAQELDIDFVGAGGQFFERALIDRLLLSVANPIHTGELDYSRSAPRWVESPSGRILLWCNLEEERPVPGEYVAGFDICMGVGGEGSSQSAASIIQRTTGEKVCEFKTGSMSPTEFARYCVALCKWFHKAKMNWGYQGPGRLFGKTVRDLGYRHVHFGRKGDNKPGKQAGVMESKESKLSMMGDYRDALSRGRFINPSRAAIEELKQFIYANETVEHSRAIQDGVETDQQGKLHGDIAIADSMANLLLPVAEVEQRTAANRPPPAGSVAWLRQEYLQEQRNKSYII